MAAATLLARSELPLPGVEIVRLEVTDGETYTSRKFGTITHAFATGNADNDAHLNVTFSGGVATINYASQTDQPVSLMLIGRG